MKMKRAMMGRNNDMADVDNTDRLSDATICAFLANQPNGSQVVHEDLEQIHKDDLEEIDLKWQLALLSMKERKFYQRIGKKIIINGSDTPGYDKTKNGESVRIMKKTRSPRVMSSIEHEFKGYGPKNSEQESNVVCDKKSDNSAESLVEEQVSQDTSSFVESSSNVDKETVFSVNKKVEFTKPRNHEKTVKKSVRPTKPNGASLAFKRHNYIDARGRSDGCSRHMTGNIAYLLDFKEFNRGYVAFGGEACGGRITGLSSLGKFDVQSDEGTYFNDLQVEDGPNNENAEQERFADDSSTKDVNVVGQHVNTVSLNVNTGSLKLNVVGPSVNTASSNKHDSPEDIFFISNHYIEPTELKIQKWLTYGFQGKLNVKMFNHLYVTLR
ncbi:hypothetical protein Tco_1410934 [Tanacetum coccineum]